MSKRLLAATALCTMIAGSVAAHLPYGLWQHVAASSTRPGYDIGYGSGLSGSATGALDMKGFLLSDSTRPLTLGTTATTSRSLTAGGVLVGGALEVDGYIWMDGGGQFSTVNMTSDAAMYFNQGYGVNKTASLIGNSTIQVPAALQLQLSDASNNMLILAAANRTANMGLAASTNPRLAIFSAAATTTLYLSLLHDQTNGVISTGAGALDLNPATGGVRLGRVIGATVAAPATCAAGTAGMVVYVDDNDDAAPAELCICAETTDDTVFDWVQVQNMAAACTLI